MQKILIVDDHAIFRRGLKDILSDEMPGAIITESDKGYDALELVQLRSWDVVILDINLPDKNGVEILKDMKLLRPTLPVLMLSLYPEDQYALRAFKAGASGYLTKESVAEELIAAINKLIGGGRYVSQSLAEQLVSTITIAEPTLPHQKLSDRELEVFRLIAQGASLAEIADTLSVSAKTISTYKSRILEKMHLKTTAELIRYAVDHKFLD